MIGYCTLIGYKICPTFLFNNDKALYKETYQTQNSYIILYCTDRPKKKKLSKWIVQFLFYKYNCISIYDFRFTMIVINHQLKISITISVLCRQGSNFKLQIYYLTSKNLTFFFLALFNLFVCEEFCVLVIMSCS